MKICPIRDSTQNVTQTVVESEWVVGATAQHLRTLPLGGREYAGPTFEVWDFDDTPLVPTFARRRYPEQGRLTQRRVLFFPTLVWIRRCLSSRG